MRERDVEAYLVKYIKSHGGIAYKFNSPNRRNVPDRLICLPDGFGFFVECKAPSKKPTAAQLREHERLRKLGFVVIVVDSKTAVDRLDDEILGACLWNKYKRSNLKTTNKKRSTSRSKHRSARCG